jgi:endonuclease/exonuclease/phosphatase (EEP) superfamily protein YafD
LLPYESKLVPDNQNTPQPLNDNVKPTKLKHRQWGTATFGLLAGIAGLVAGRLGHLYPHFDVFAQFGAQFIMGTLAFAFGMMFTRFKTTIGIATTLALLAAYGAWPHLTSASLTNGPFILQTGEKQLRIAHFNTWAENTNYKAIADEILRLNADVVSLVEMDQKKKDTIIPALKAVYPNVFDCTGQIYCELVIISKYPLQQAEGNGHWVGAPYAKATLGGEMSGVTFVAVHTTRFPFSRAQLTQVRELVRKLESVSGDLVVMGDFNATPFSRVNSTFSEGANLARLTELPTWPAQLEIPQLAIDHAFASSNFRVIGNQQIGNAAGSDHYPIVLTLARKATK